MKKRSKKNNVVIRPSVEDVNGKYRLYINWHENKKIPILDINGQSYEGGEYITNNLYKTLKSYVEKKRISDDFTDIISEISLIDFPLLFEILNKGKELKFF